MLILQCLSPSELPVVYHIPYSASMMQQFQSAVGFRMLILQCLSPSELPIVYHLDDAAVSQRLRMGGIQVPSHVFVQKSCLINLSRTFYHIHDELSGKPGKHYATHYLPSNECKANGIKSVCLVSPPPLGSSPSFLPHFV